MNEIRKTVTEIVMINNVLKESHPKLAKGLLPLDMNGDKYCFSGSVEPISEDEANDLLAEMRMRLAEAKAITRFEARLKDAGLVYSFKRAYLKVEGMIFRYGDELEELEGFISDIAGEISALGKEDNPFARFVKSGKKDASSNDLPSDAIV